MENLLLRSFVLLTVACYAYDINVGIQRPRICPWLTYENTTCSKLKFLCRNKNCIDRSSLCDGKPDCGSGDHSDEDIYDCMYWYKYERERRKERYSCDKYIPKEWICDGIPDCRGGTDEKFCGYRNNDKLIDAMNHSLIWLYNERKSDPPSDVWGPLVDKTAIALYFTDSRFTDFNSWIRKEVAYEASIQLLSRLFREKLEGIPSTDLASYVNAFLVSCINPRKFHGIDLIQELRNRVDKLSYTNPYVFLSLCNAGEKITESDKEKLMNIFWNKQRIFWTDMQAFTVMALMCANKQGETSDIDKDILSELTMELKKHQYRNGSVEDFQTTALVLQAIFSAEPSNNPDIFDERKAVEQILFNQKLDGSFGNLINTYFVLPVLSCQSLVNISSKHCKFQKRDKMSALNDLVNQRGPKKRVQYSLWIEGKNDLARNLALRVPFNMSLYQIMEIAAEIDNRYSFQYSMKNHKPYVNVMSDLQDNPEKGKFWFLYIIKDGDPILIQKSPADVMPADNDHFVMWYRNGSWIG